MLAQYVGKLPNLNEGIIIINSPVRRATNYPLSICCTLLNEFQVVVMNLENKKFNLNHFESF